jgi:hypothetical protein
LGICPHIRYFAALQTLYIVLGLHNAIRHKESQMTRQAEYLEESIVILAIRSQLGNIGLAARELGLSRGELVDYMSKHPAVMDARIQVREAIKDDAEDLLISQMQTEPGLLMFFLRTQAKDRGYDTSKTLTTNNNVQVNVDARSLIAAMRNGTKAIDAQEDDIAEEGELFTIPRLLHDDSGSGGIGEVLQ